MKEGTEQVDEVNGKLEEEMNSDGVRGAFKGGALNDEIEEEFLQTGE